MGQDYERKELNRHEYHLGQELTYLPTGEIVRVFGRERETPGLDSPVIYYWVFEGGNRFKANPQQLAALKSACNN